jgi:hypothetical protein
VKWIVTAALLVAACGEPTRPSQTLRGVVEAVTPPGLQVAGVSVVTHNNTQITTRSGSTFNLSALRRGDTVTVRGDRRSDDSLDADEIETEGSEIEFRGVIDSVNPPNLSVAGRVIVTDSATEFGGEDEDSAFTLADLHAGDTVKVEGVLQPDSTILAREIELRRGENDEGEHPDEEAEVEGAVDSLFPPDLMVAGHLVHTDSMTEIRHDGDTLSLGDLHVGERVKVEGVLESDGSILAQKIEPNED